MNIFAASLLQFADYLEGLVYFSQLVPFSELDAYDKRILLSYMDFIDEINSKIEVI